MNPLRCYAFFKIYNSDWDDARKEHSSRQGEGRVDRLLSISPKVPGGSYIPEFTYDSLSLRKKPSLYARMCAVKIDLDAPLRRLGKVVMLPQALANELVKRCIVLKRFKATSMAHIINPMPEEEETLDEMLWTAFFIVLENDDRNVIQLRNSGVAGWLDAYWFDTAGSSHAMSLLQDDEWPALGLGSPRNSISPYRCSQQLTLAMWCGTMA